MLIASIKHAGEDAGCPSRPHQAVAGGGAAYYLPVCGSPLTWCGLLRRCQRTVDNLRFTAGRG